MTKPVFSKWVKIIAIALLGCVQFACLSRPGAVDAMPDDPRYAPVYTPTLNLQPAANGSIYNSRNAVDLYQRRAHRVGDILTVFLNESTTASKTAGTSFSKESSGSVSDQTAIGRGFLGTGIELNGSLNAGTDFSGESDADQSNQLEGSITVTVSDVLPNGALRIRGEKWLQLNRGDEYIRISGLIRREDITPSNTIDSTRIADVRIAYSETGTLSKANQPGWLTRFFVGDIWPF